MNELTVTVVGWAASDAKLTVGRSGASVASFRLASTPRYFDKARGVWVDGATEWFSVRAFRGAAILIEQSIRKGQPVVVAGRLRTNTWVANDGPRTELVIDATAVGPDCTRGVSRFSRATGSESMGDGDGTAASEAIEAARTAEDAEETAVPMDDEPLTEFDETLLDPDEEAEPAVR